tara:strand:- start:3644 stop:4282 length:639 start_codon:yes stop_codon:yes gene_type:complete
MQLQFLTRSSGVLTEAVVVFAISFLVIGNITYTDIVFHDFYVLPAIETCYPENQSEFCTNIRDRHGIASDAQIEIGNIYWNELLRQAIFNGVILFAIRIGFAWMAKRTANRKIRPVTILVALIWGLTASGLFLFGFLDFLYYELRAMDVPEQLPWLNNTGLFAYTQSYFGDPNTVDIQDLIATMLIGVGVFGAVWLFAMYAYVQSGLKQGFA